ncbi:TetR/AcrR family transcriptional regulator [Lentibacillus saliphilus]|uniref:TetR/AcrR family transcriptional regulator n=1 Tax=Lentibacillus saliphilus TaxID=2737028 RepID=UPI001C2FBF9B
MESFLNIEPDKQQRILNAALNEFAAKGFDQASTNEIVKAAGIGKGMLFYYFKSKKELFHYLLRYSFDIVETLYIDQVDMTEKNFIKRVQKAARYKFEVYAKHPNVFEFLSTALISEHAELPKDIQKRYDTLYTDAYQKMYDNIDYSLFRSDMDKEKVMQVIQWTFDGFEKQLIEKLKHKNVKTIAFEPYWDLFDDYLETLEKAFITHGRD